MRYISFVVPSYNSEDYLERCVDTLMPDSTDVEIIIVNDGSKDRTAEIADRYREKYPDTVRVVHKENGGHGSAVNKGLELAKGQYLKVVDSDDWLDTESLKKLLAHLKEWESSGTRIDLIMCNYIYDHLYDNKQKVMTHFSPSQYIIMHSAMFRTDVLRESGVVLPEHTFYVDNIFTHQPLCYAKTLCYLDLNLYHYFLGRDDQSVNEQVLMKRIDQQLKVNKMILDRVVTPEERKAPKKLRKYLIRNLSIMTTISCLHLLMIGTDEALAKRDDLWNTIKQKDKKIYRQLRYHTLSGGAYLPFGKLGDKLTMNKMCCKDELRTRSAFTGQKSF